MNNKKVIAIIVIVIVIIGIIAMLVMKSKDNKNDNKKEETTNSSTEKINDSIVYDVEVDNTKNEVGIDFTLPGNITVGSKELEIESIYGKLDDTFKIRNEVSMSTTYHYNYLDHKYLDLIVYDNGGLKAFKYTFK